VFGDGVESILEAKSRMEGRKGEDTNSDDAAQKIN
jgi:hypothetical protein